MRGKIETAVRDFLESREKQAAANLHLPGYIPYFGEAQNTISDNHDLQEDTDLQEIVAEMCQLNSGPGCFLPSKEVLRWLCDDKQHMGSQGLRNLAVEHCDYEPDGQKTVMLVAVKEEGKGQDEPVEQIN